MFSLSLATAAVATHDHYYYYIYWWASGPQPHHQPVDSFVYDELRESETSVCCSRILNVTAWLTSHNVQGGGTHRNTILKYAAKRLQHCVINLLEGICAD